MDVLEQLRKRATDRPKRIIFPESQDPRVIEAANQFQSAGLGQAIVVADQRSADLNADVQVVNSEDAEQRETVIARLIENRKHKGMDRQRAEQALEDPVLFLSLIHI